MQNSSKIVGWRTVEIDGSVLEGGGQILRIAISLSAILRIPVKVTNIRAGRSKPGLAAQHQKGIQLVGEMCQARLRGVDIGSTEIEFTPGKIRAGHYFVDTYTAGSVSLLLQVALPCALLADGPVSFDLRGGTNAEMAPQVDYMTDVFVHTLKKFGGYFAQKVEKRGYFPRGGGHVSVEVKPVRQFKSANIIDSGDLRSISGRAFVAGSLPLNVADKMADGAREALRNTKVNLKIESYKENPQIAPDNGSGISLWCETSSDCVLGADALGRRGLAPHLLGHGAAGELLGALRQGACVDRHTQDQIILYMALAEGVSVVKAGDITLHTRTAIHVVELLSKAKFNIRTEGEVNFIECTGIGYENKDLLLL